MAGFIDMIAEIGRAGGVREWLRRKSEFDAAQPTNDADLHRRIERRAFLIWEKAGRPEGQADEHWQRAVEMESPGGAALSNTSSLAEDIERLQFQSDLAEVQLLLDFVSGRPNKALFAGTGPPAPGQVTTGGLVAPPAAGGAGQEATPPNGTDYITSEELDQLAKIRFPPNKGPEANAADAMLLLRLRDKLNRFASPASGLTIAFTLMTWTPFNQWKLHNDWARWKLANQAYPRLRSSLRMFWLSTITLIPIAFVSTFVTVRTSHTVADGQSKTSRIKTLVTRQQDITQQIADVEKAVVPTSATEKVTRFCQRPQNTSTASKQDPTEQKVADLTGAEQTRTDAARTEEDTHSTFDSSQQHELCDRFHTFQIEADAAVTDLKQWWANWKGGPAVPGPAMIAAPARPGMDGWPKLVNPVGADGGVILSPPEYVSAVDTLADLTNIYLPVTYGFIGSIVAAFRSVYTKISTSTLAPWDTRLMWTRLLLGTMAGACIGLFFSPSGTSVQGSTGLGSLSLSAVAFLAGYAVDDLFTMLDGIIRRLFRLEPEAPPPR